MVYGSDLTGSEYGGFETAVGSMIETTLLHFMDDGPGWNFELNDFDWNNTIFYSGGFLNYLLNSGPDRNPYRKDW